MKASKARKRTFNALVKKLYKNAISDIKKAADSGEYSADVEILDLHKFEDVDCSKINDRLFERLIEKEYRLGMTAHGKRAIKKVFWSINPNL